ncbi:hypothetical protein [Nitrogeniibacter aestuarii]|uniref:hypothetical protein n=1 Tax=Nitrogeniibacter aestuarii TaxID=2815343 RepID=UPI001E5D0FFE|nr:hypothetical protein [Nitrogeniibacter aestuarii]
MNFIAKLLSIIGMMTTVAWLFWNPIEWEFQWEPFAAFIFSLSSFIATEVSTQRRVRTSESHPNDVQLFSKFLKDLPNESFIDFLKEHDFLLDFNLEDLKPLRIFLIEWDNAAHEFQDKDLEVKRKNLMEAGQELMNLIGLYTSPNSGGWQGVRHESLKGNPLHEERFREEARLIDVASDRFVEIHQDLVRTGRRSICI